MGAMLVSFTACSPRMMLVNGLANELAGQGQIPEEDLDLARESSAFYLKLSESVLLQSPGNLKLAEAVAGGFTQYAFAFVSFEADRAESKDARRAQKLRERAARLYLRAHRHAMIALEHHQPGFGSSLANPNPALWPRIRDAEVGIAYWAAASWGGLISLSKDDPDTVADLPLAMRLAKLAWERSPGFGDGALATLMGSFEVARPGGSAEAATAFFDRAIATSHGKNAGAFVAKAEAIALPSRDRASFDALLQQALAASASRRDLANVAMRERALWLIDVADDIF
jgi:predicted anti-sigma-YlaC factor YlaD